jgi:alkaline phosphatase D
MTFVSVGQRRRISIFTIIVSLYAGIATAQPAMPTLGQGLMSGEVTENTVILQARLTSEETDATGDLPGMRGVGRFEISTDRDFTRPIASQWLTAESDYDYILKAQLNGLKPATQYYYRLAYGPNQDNLRHSDTATFRTLAGKNITDAASFVVVTGMNYAFFHYGSDGKGKQVYTGDDKHLGFPALATIKMLKPDFFVGTGDNIYYDHPKEGRAETLPAMRKKWHEQLMQPRFVDLFRNVSTYWEKDDHDHRFNDNDNTGNKRPSSVLGIDTFKEQVPVTDPTNPAALTYRTHRINRDLQIWLVEGRDYRSPNKMPDGPDKTLWGAKQLAWLKRTLLESDATFKILISPTPLIGPDDAYKTDNHVNHDGFRTEGDAFFAWLKNKDFLNKNFYLMCGDRHWQYHSIHPSGFEEFSTGALVDANSRLGRVPGDPKSTDPDAKVRQPYYQDPASGGFVYVQVQPGTPAKLDFTFLDENGVVLYTHTKTQ